MMSAVLRIDEHVDPRTAGGPLPFRSKTVIRPCLHRYALEVEVKGLGEVPPNGLDMRSQPDCAEHDKAVDIPDRVAHLREITGELLDKSKASRILIIGVILRKVGAQVAMGYGAGQCVNEGMTQHVAVGMGVETHVGWDLHAAQDKRVPRHEPMDVAPQTSAKGWWTDPPTLSSALGLPFNRLVHRLAYSALH
jgi:hypothetical protein